MTLTIDYLAGQIEAGVEAVQLFDSWAGSLAPDQFETQVIAPNARIAAALTAAGATGVYPTVVPATRIAA